MTITKANVRCRLNAIREYAAAAKCSLEDAVCRILVGMGDGGTILHRARHEDRAYRVLNAIRREDESRVVTTGKEAP